MVIRNTLGLVIASCSQRLSQAYSSDEVEAFVAAKTLSFAAEIGITKAVLEGDSLTIIKALSIDHWSLSSFGPLIDDAKFVQLILINCFTLMSRENVILLLIV